MAASRESFLKLHWDKLAAAGGLAAAAAAGFFMAQSLSVSPDEAAERYREESVDGVKPSGKKVAEADLGVFGEVFKSAQNPPSLGALDPKKASFLASEGRVFCEKKSCGKPIPSASQKCPFCGEEQNVKKEEPDTDKDGMPNDWERKYGFNPEDPSDASKDADGDGFTNLEEFKAGTDPKDRNSHPDYLDYLSVASPVSDVNLDFYFKDAQKIRDGYRFTFQRLSVKNKNARRTYTAVMNGEITTGESNKKFRDDSGWKVVGYEQKQVEVKIAGSSLTRKDDASEVTIERVSDGKRITLKVVADERRHAARKTVALESKVDLAWSRGEGKTFAGMAEGSAFSINERKYKVVKLAKGSAGAEVTVLDVAAKKERTIR